MNIYKISDVNGKTVKYICTENSYEYLGKINKDENDLNDCTSEKNTKLVDNNYDSIDGYVEILGKKYKTVNIGNQTWLAENLDFETDTGSVKHEIGGYGRMYQWDKAVEVANSIEGWHLPSREEWNELYKNVGGNANELKSESFGGTDYYGFGVLPAGYYYGNYRCVGSNAYFWTSDERSCSDAYNEYFDKGSNMNSNNNYETYYYSVRLVKD